MAKKTFIASPRPRGLDPATIDRFVEEGHGHDARSKDTHKHRDTEPREPVPMARLTVDMPRELHRRFKVACAAHDTRMNDEIRNFIERRLAELES